MKPELESNKTTELKSTRLIKLSKSKPDNSINSIKNINIKPKISEKP